MLTSYAQGAISDRARFARGNAVNPGLDDVVVAETVLSHVDGAGGRLIVRGHELEDIAATDQLSAVEALRLCLASLADADTTPHYVLAAAAVPVFVAAIARRRAGQAPIAPDPTIGQAADFLRMMRGKNASA